jgi:hypothetical protein
MKLTLPAILLLLSSLLSCGVSNGTDFALSKNASAWLQHPVYGGPSFDTFKRVAANPVHRGSPPYAWPVNGFLFEDPPSGKWYLYIGHYLDGYGLNESHPSMCTVLRSNDRGLTWENVGPIFDAKEFLFRGEVSPLFHAPDVSVVYSDNRYHLCFDWTTKNTTWENAGNPPADANSGVGYAWSDTPEGPYHISPEPIATTRDQQPILGKYRRLYASTLLRRANDWLVLTLTDSGSHYGWALLGMTAKAPEGPYTEPQLLLHPELDRYHPPLLEFFPSFVHDGMVYSPATSVALNRNVQAMFRAPLENAMDSHSWELYQLGSLWHAEPIENEWRGIWGQTYSGFVDKKGLFNVMYPSRDKAGLGTINLAQRRWDSPARTRGFWTTAHEGSSLAVLRRSGPAEKLEAEFRIKEEYFSSLGILWGLKSPLGPDKVSSDASPGRITQWHDTEMRLSPTSWSLVQHRKGEETIIGTGAFALPELVAVTVEWNKGGTGSIFIGAESVWSGPLPAEDGLFGIRVYPHTWAAFARFALTGAQKMTTIVYDVNEGMLGAAQRRADWKPVQDVKFTYGLGIISQNEQCTIKWNVEGTKFRIRAPKGPGYGSASVFIDGKDSGRIDYSSAEEQASSNCYSHEMPDGRYSIALRNFTGTVPVDVIEVDTK